MNAFKQLIPQNILEALGWTFFHSLWQFAVVAIMLGILLFILGRFSSQFRYFLVSSGYVFLLIMAIYTFAMNYSNSPNTLEESVLIPTVITEDTVSESVGDNQLVINQTKMVHQPFFVTWYKELQSFFSNQFPILVMLWLLGILVLSLRFFGNLAYLHRLKNYRTIPMDEHWQQWMQNVKARLGINSNIKLLQSSLAKAPMVVGAFKPVILLPLSAISGISVREMECIIAHELAHVKRHDYLINLIQKLVEILFFYHPAVWWMSSVVKSERENCCDDIAISLTGDSVNFVKALAIMEEKRVHAGLAVAFSGQKNKLLKRIQRLLNQRKMKANFMEGFIASCVIFMGLIALAFSVSTEPKGKPLPGINNSFKPVTVGDTNSYNVLKSLEQGDTVLSSTPVPAQPVPEPEEPEIAQKEEILTKKHEYHYEYRTNRKHELDEAYHYDRHHHQEDGADIDIIVREAMDGMNAALAEIDVDVIVDEALKAAEEGIREAEIEHSIHEAIRAAQESLREIDINAIINEAIHAARECSEEVDVEEIIEEITIEIENAMDDIDIEIKSHDLNETNKHKRIIEQGVSHWNNWREKHPDITPQLIGVNLHEANLTNANLENANLMGADLKEANLRNANLTGAKLQGANLKEATLDGTILKDAVLTGADLKEVDLIGKDLRSINFIGANLKEASLRKSDLRDADLRGANLKEADVAGADLRDTDLRGTDLSEANTRGANFKNALANRNTLFPPNFDADSEGVIFD